MELCVFLEVKFPGLSSCCAVLYCGKRKYNSSLLNLLTQYYCRKSLIHGKPWNEASCSSDSPSRGVQSFISRIGKLRPHYVSVCLLQSRTAKTTERNTPNEPMVGYRNRMRCNFISRGLDGFLCNRNNVLKNVHTCDPYSTNQL